ncbi:MAG: alpha/beta hydrolase [Clostridiales bacterium]|nr:MAG: alpha/beta hydrolase [Clostridiales bacterium]
MEIEIDGLQINYRIEGEGKPLLMLHGWGGCIDSFAPVIREMSKYRKVYALDFPGFGESEEPQQAVGVPEYTKWVVKFIRGMHIEGTDIICHSFGGRVSILLAAEYPELVGKIVFTDAAGVRPRRGLKYYGKVYTYKLCKKLLACPRLSKALRCLGIDVEKRVKNAGSSDYQQLSGTMRQTFVKVVNQNLTPYLKKIQAPSLLIYGENDQDTPVRYGKIMEKEIKDAGLVVLKNAGHFSYLDQYPHYISIVKVFLEVEK